MKQIQDNSVFHIRCTVDSAPRDIYLIKSLDKIKELFVNAYILPRVQWHTLANFYEFFTGNKLDEKVKFPDHRWSRHYENDRKIREEINLEVEQFKEEILSMYTVIPFTPSLEDYRSSIKEWKLDSDVMVLTNSKNVNRRSSSSSQTSQFFSILLANSHNMGMLVEGVLYESPCRLCKFVLNKLAGECEIYKSDRQSTTMCTPRINFNAQLFTSRDVSTLEEIDYAEVMQIWQDEQQKLEV